MKTIFLDIDGVLANWCLGACKITCGEKKYYDFIQSGKFSDIEFHKGFHHYNKNYLEFEKFIVESREDFSRKIEQAGFDFWFCLDLFPWSKNLYSELSKRYKVYFLSNPGNYSWSSSAKVQWLNMYFGDGSSKRLILTKDKHFVKDNRNGSILIDDLYTNCKEYIKNESGKHQAILFPNQFQIEKDNINVVDYILADVEHLNKDF